MNSSLSKKKVFFRENKLGSATELKRPSQTARVNFDNLDLQLHLVRHAQTDWNIHDRLQGQLDIPLNSVGYQQARTVCQYLRPVKFDKFFCSPLQRAKVTAEIILDDRPVELKAVPEFQEVCHGDWQGKLVAELRLLYPYQFHLWETHPLECRKPNGETLYQVWERVIPAWEMLLQSCFEDAHKRVLVVAHKFIIQIILCHVSGLDLKHFWDFPQDNCSINVIDYDFHGASYLRVNNFNIYESTSAAA
ncbi:MAG: histidine phosphatase family protein [Cyanothece sp. SIO1E1]|nr:histidine phosphatase family protein [Cyanothece sp. SIO1E1]